jgi:signal transduction histidine kinase
MHFLFHPRRVCLFIGYCFFVLTIPAQSQVALTSDQDNIRLDPAIKVWIDTAHLSFEEVLQADQKLFRSYPSLTFGYLQEPIWLQIQLKDLGRDTNWFLRIPAPFLEYIDYYQQLDSGWQHSQSGYYLPQSKRIHPHTDQVLPILFKSDHTTVIYIRVAGISPKTFAVFAQSEPFLTTDTRFNDLWYGAFFGILLVMFLYNLFIYLSLRQSNYLLYMGTIVCTFLIFSSASGYAGKFLWPEIPSINFYTGRMTLGLLVIVLTIFTIRFLEVKKYSRVMYYLLVSLIPLAGVAMVLVAFQKMSSAGNNLITLCTLLFIITGIICRIQGNRTATYYIAAWTIYLFGGALLTLRNSGVFEFNFWTTHFVELGAAMETSIIAFALGDRYRRYKEEIEKTQRMALKIQQEATEKLETKVKERTRELTAINAELSVNLETIRKQSETIEAKNAELDAFFYRISHDLKGPISSLLGLTNLAGKEVTDVTALEYINRQHHQVKRLDTVITGLINLARLNNSDLPKEEIDFHRLIDECIQAFRGYENFDNVHFQKEVKADSGYHSYWVLLNAILQNLIENAIKYARKENPYVRISIHLSEKHLMIQVEDNGQGISKDQQTKVFDMFYRATENANGSGLGLYILKRSVDRLHGSIELVSEETLGSTFIIKLPATAPMLVSQDPEN